MGYNSSRDIYVDDASVAKDAQSMRDPFRCAPHLSDSDGSYQQVYPATIFVDVRTGEFFPVSANLPHGDAESVERFAKEYRLLGTFTHGIGHRNIDGQNSDIVLFAGSRGIEKLGAKIVIHELGQNTYDSIVGQINKGQFYSDKYAPKQEQTSYTHKIDGLSGLPTQSGSEGP